MIDALQAAIDSEDSIAILNIVSGTPMDELGPLAAYLLTAAQGSPVNDRQFAAILAALAFVSGSCMTAQQNASIVVVRNAPAGLVIVNNLLSTNLNGGFGFASANLTGLVLQSRIVAENQNQTQAELSGVGINWAEYIRLMCIWGRHD